MSTEGPLERGQMRHKLQSPGDVVVSFKQKIGEGIQTFMSPSGCIILPLKDCKKGLSCVKYSLNLSFLKQEPTLIKKGQFFGCAWVLEIQDIKSLPHHW